MRIRLIFGLAAALCTVYSCTMPSVGRGRIEGRVLQSTTGGPVEGVKVTYSNIEVLTDETGYFFLDTIPEGLQGITFSKMGFEKLVEQVAVTRDETVSKDFTLNIMTNGWAVGSVETGYGTIFFSENGGLSWVRQGVSGMIPPNDLLCACAVNNKCCWIGGDSTYNIVRGRDEFSILKTSDGGSTWRRMGQTISAVDPHPIVGIAAVDTMTAYAVTNINVILKGTSGGASWDVCHESEYISSYNSISTPDGVHVWASGSFLEGGVAGLDYSPDGGDTWEFIPVDMLSSNDTIIDISAADSDLVYISGTFGIMRTWDRGNSWERVVEAIPLFSFTLCTIGSNFAWTGIGGGDVLYTYNAFENTGVGKIETSFDGLLVSSISFLGDAMEGALTCYAIDKTLTGGLMCTLDGGKTWYESRFPYKTIMQECSFAGTRH